MTDLSLPYDRNFKNDGLGNLYEGTVEEVQKNLDENDGELVLGLDLLLWPHEVDKELMEEGVSQDKRERIHAATGLGIYDVVDNYLEQNDEIAVRIDDIYSEHDGDVWQLKDPRDVAMTVGDYLEKETHQTHIGTGIKQEVSRRFEY